MKRVHKALIIPVLFLFLLGLVEAQATWSRFSNVNITGLLSVEKMNAANCDVKAATNGTFYCGTDNAAAAGVDYYWHPANLTKSPTFYWSPANLTSSPTFYWSLANITGLSACYWNVANMTDANVGNNLTITTSYNITVQGWIIWNNGTGLVIEEE